MSNHHYDEFCKADIPELTQLDRQLLGHYCARFNEDVRPPRAWPPLYELKLVTGAHEKSISRSLGRLRRRALLLRVTLASKTKGLRAEYAPNLTLIKSYQVTEQLPNTSDFIDVQVTEQLAISNPTVLEGNSSVTTRSPSSYPKRIKPIKPKNVDKNIQASPASPRRWATLNIERFYEVILEGVPSELRSTIKQGANYEALLDVAETLGLSHNAIRGHLNATNWQNVHSAGGIVLLRLQELIDERNRLLVKDQRIKDFDTYERLRIAQENRAMGVPDEQNEYLD